MRSFVLFVCITLQNAAFFLLLLLLFFNICVCDFVFVPCVFFVRCFNFWGFSLLFFGEVILFFLIHFSKSRATISIFCAPKLYAFFAWWKNTEIRKSGFWFVGRFHCCWYDFWGTNDWFKMHNFNFPQNSSFIFFTHNQTKHSGQNFTVVFN